MWQRGLDWIEAHRHEFEIGSDSGVDDVFALKALGELARLADLLCRRRDLPPSMLERPRALLEFAWAGFGRGQLFADLLAQRPLPALGTMYSIFEPHGFVHQETRRALTALAQPGGLKGLTQSAPRPREPLTRYGADGAAVAALGLALAWRVLGIPSPWSETRLFPHTELARCPELRELSEGQAYSLTHAVFFMTDFGGCPERLPAECRAYLARAVPAWIGGFGRELHHDLVAELALALACAGLEVLDVEPLLAEAQAEDGMMPGPDLGSLLAGGSDDRRLFIRAYHPTITAVMASFAVRVGLGPH